MSGYDGAAWLQFHRGRRLGTIPPPSPDEARVICRDGCGLLTTPAWDQAIYGDTAPICPGFRDPSDEQGANVEYRGVR